MKKRELLKIAIIVFIAFFILIPSLVHAEKQLIFDDAEVLSSGEKSMLEDLARKYGAERKTDFIILTVGDPEAGDIEKYMADFYDNHKPGFDRPGGNTVILAVEFYKSEGKNEFYLAGFEKGEKYVDNARADQITDKLIPYLKAKDYVGAFETFIETTYDYMGYRPGVNPESIFFDLWFQVLIAIGIGGAVIGVMMYHSGGRVTVNQGTYMDTNKTRVNQRRDAYIRTTVSKRRKPSNNSGSGRGGGGGGVTRGGSSYSGSRKSF